MKTFYIMHNVGRSRYVVNFHDGRKSHQDGSPFFDIEILKSKKALTEFVNGLLYVGYIKL
jgi:hypothetical protein